ncbi:hypothetical protein AX16_005707 [Volvariella volvacea WC 439]|nr:hypothetical protein AX16_005707 [Volvariella volvacea WC 439]
MADAVAENPIIVNIMDSYGAIIIGCFFSCVTWGISCMQVFLYFFNYDSDHWAIRSLVLFVWSMDTANQILMLKSVFPVLITQWGRVAGLFESQIELLHHNWVGGLVAIGVQMFFLYRIYVFSGNKWLFPALMTPVVWWQLIGTIPYNVVVSGSGTTGSPSFLSQGKLYDPSCLTIGVFADLKALPQALSTSLRAVSCAVDVIIAIAMSYLLAKNGRSTFRNSKKLVFRLIILTINTGIWTAVDALLVLVMLLVYSNNLIFCVFEFPLSGLYVNTLMANLNARRYLKNTGDKEWNSGITPNPSSNLPLSNISRRGDPHHQENTVTIRVETSQAVKGDDDYPPSKHVL